MRLFVVAGAAVLLGLAGCSGSAEVNVGSSESAAPSASTQAPDGQTTTYTSDKYGFSFEYAPPFEEKTDTSWEAQSEQSSADSVAVFDVEGTQVAGQYRDAFVVNVYQLNTEINESNIGDVATELEQNVIPQLEQAGQNMQISELVSTEVNGLQGYQADATFTVDGTPMTSQLYFLFDGDLEYQLLVQSASDRWQELQPTFEAMVDSFQVTPVDAAVTPSEVASPAVSESVPAG